LVLGGGIPLDRKKTFKKFGKNVQLLLNFDGLAKKWTYNIDIDTEDRIRFIYDRAKIKRFKNISRLIYWSNDMAWRYNDIITDMIPDICQTLNNTYNDIRYHKLGKQLFISLMKANWIDINNNNSLIIVTPWEDQRQI
jgi:hypothetical protein